MNKTSFVLIGPGNLGLSLASLLSDRGYHCSRVIATSEEQEGKIYKWLPEPTPIQTLEHWRTLDVNLVLVATPDDELRTVAASLADKFAESASRKTLFVHFSGMQTSAIFQALIDLGYSAASLHPLQTLPSVEMGRKSLINCPWAFEGESREQCQSLVDDLDGRMIEISAEAKVPYHLAAVFASNLLIALEDMAVDIAQEAEITPEQFVDFFGPLIKQTIDNFLQKRTVEVISGPVRRNDVHTIQKHLAWMDTADEKYRKVYMELSHYLSELLFAEDVISIESLDALNQTFEELE